MNPKYLIINLFLLILIFGIFYPVRGQKSNENPEVIITNQNATGIDLEIEFFKGNAYSHPVLAIWIEDLEGNYIQTLYVSKAVATGIYGHQDLGAGKWKNEAGEARRPAALPYFLHKRGIKANDGTYLPSPAHPVPDAFSGATPKGNFQMQTHTDQMLLKKFRLLFEINQPFDFNPYWTNTLYPDDADYKTSGQPALVYSVTIDPASEEKEYFLNPIGHSHYSGKDGKLFTDLSSLTSALEIVKKIKITLK